MTNEELINSMIVILQEKGGHCLKSELIYDLEC